MAIMQGLRQLTAVEKRIKHGQKRQQKMQRLRTMLSGRTPNPQKRKIA